MRVRLLIAPALMLAAICSMVPTIQSARADDAPICFDAARQEYRPATKWLTSPGTLSGTPGNDVLVGSIGSDVINGNGGNDLICTAPYGLGFGAPDQVDGGAGNDRLFGVGNLKGSSGNDFVATYSSDSYGDGGPGSDLLYISYGGSGNGGSGNDEVIGDHASKLDGGSGNDAVHGNDNGTMLGGSGNDLVANAHGNPTIDCGAGRDRVTPNGATNVKNCEGSIVSPP